VQSPLLETTDLPENYPTSPLTGCHSNLSHTGDTFERGVGADGGTHYCRSMEKVKKRMKSILQSRRGVKYTKGCCTVNTEEGKRNIGLFTGLYMFLQTFYPGRIIPENAAQVSTQHNPLSFMTSSSREGG
jgi:hypothetical protein